jgi:hypothetical protein
MSNQVLVNVMKILKKLLLDEKWKQNIFIFWNAVVSGIYKAIICNEKVALKKGGLSWGGQFSSISLSASEIWSLI